MRLTPLFLLLAACPTPKDDTGETGDADTDTDTDTDTDWDPNSTLCGELRIESDCGKTLPSTVGVWSITSGYRACQEDTGGWYDTGPYEWWGDTEVATPTVESDGTFQADVDPGDYGLLATAGSCYACVPVTLVDGSCPVLDVVMDWHETADKPNVYLYPEAPARIGVTIGSPERLTAEDPLYGDGWDVVAFPDGRLRTAEGSRDFLFYERSVDVERFQHEEGFCTTGRQAVAAMEDHLAAMGFLPNEIADFGEAWDADLPRAGWMTIYPQTSHLPALKITPRPDNLVRAWYLVEAGCQPVREPEITPVERTGYHAAEWGVILDGSLVREPVVIGWPG